MAPQPKLRRKTVRVRLSAEYLSRFPRRLHKGTNRTGDGYMGRVYFNVRWDGTKSFQSYAACFIEEIPAEEIEMNLHRQRIVTAIKRRSLVNVNP